MLDEQQAAQLSCNTEIDYSEVIGDRILPFLIQLDLEASILNPAPGQNQRFCYKITGTGSNASIFADLSHSVFGICDQISQDQIVNISVLINGASQIIDFGPDGNVELKTPNKPDPPTGCPGLKFNFPLNKITGIMDICFELTSPYPIGPNLVCLFGGGTTATGLSICGPVCGTFNTTCDVAGYQKATVCVPVTVKPFADAGSTTTYCCGSPTVSTDTAPCPGTENGSCTFKITQPICVVVPVEFGATATADNTFVQCGEASSEDICTGCGDTDSTKAELTYTLKNIFHKHKAAK